MSKKRQKPESQYRPFNRMEISIAEIMRVNCPIQIANEEGDLWIDIVEDLTKMFGTKDPKFNSDVFWERCFGDQWTHDEVRRESEKLAALMDQAAAVEAGALDSAADDVHIGT
jgi:hypothetical protein